MPLSDAGLCEAVIITPSAIPGSKVRKASPGVGITPK